MVDCCSAAAGSAAATGPFLTACKETILATKNCVQILENAGT